MTGPNDPRIEHLVGPARKLAELLGYEVGLKLMAEFGGMRLDIPKRPLTKWSVREKLGHEAARVLCRLYGASRIEIPVLSRLQERQAAAARNQAIADHPGSHNDAAQVFGFTRRWIKMVRRAYREPGGLLKLMERPKR